jgi:hypothetical protein
VVRGLTFSFTRHKAITNIVIERVTQYNTRSRPSSIVRTTSADMTVDILHIVTHSYPSAPYVGRPFIHNMIKFRRQRPLITLCDIDIHLIVGVMTSPTNIVRTIKTLFAWIWSQAEASVWGIWGNYVIGHNDPVNPSPWGVLTSRNLRQSLNNLALSNMAQTATARTILS